MESSVPELPPEIITEITSYLSPIEQLRLERTSKTFQDVSKSFDLNRLKNVIQFLPDNLIAEIVSYLSIHQARRLANASAWMKKKLFPFYLEKFITEINKISEPVPDKMTRGILEINLFMKGHIPTEVRHKVIYMGSKIMGQHYTVIPDIWIGSILPYQRIQKGLYPSEVGHLLIDISKFPDEDMGKIVKSGRADPIMKGELEPLLKSLSDNYYTISDEVNRWFTSLIIKFNPYPVTIIEG